MEFPTVNRGRVEAPGTAQPLEPAARKLLQRRTKLEMVVKGICCMALVACEALVRVSATPVSSPFLLAPAAPPVQEPLPQ